jgi:hypothetical protein
MKLSDIVNSEFFEILEEYSKLKSDKTKMVKIQNYQKAAILRDKEKELERKFIESFDIDKIYEYLNISTKTRSITFLTQNEIKILKREYILSDL